MPDDKTPRKLNEEAEHGAESIGEQMAKATTSTITNITLSSIFQVILIFVVFGIIAFVFEKYLLPELGLPIISIYIASAVISFIVFVIASLKPGSNIVMWTLTSFLISFVIPSLIGYFLIQNDIEINNPIDIVAGIGTAISRAMSNISKNVSCWFRSSQFNIYNQPKCGEEEKVIQANLDTPKFKPDENLDMPTGGSYAGYDLWFKLENPNPTEKDKRRDITIKDLKMVASNTRYGLMRPEPTTIPGLAKPISNPNVVIAQIEGFGKDSKGMVLDTKGRNKEREFSVEFKNLPKCIPYTDPDRNIGVLFFQLRAMYELVDREGYSYYLLTKSEEKDVVDNSDITGAASAVEIFTQKDRTPVSDPGPLQIAVRMRPDIIYLDTGKNPKLTISLKNRAEIFDSVATSTIKVKELKIEQVFPNAKDESQIPLIITECTIPEELEKSTKSEKTSTTISGASGGGGSSGFGSQSDTDGATTTADSTNQAQNTQQSTSKETTGKIIVDSSMVKNRDEKGKIGNFIDLKIGEKDKYLSEISNQQTKSITCDIKISGKESTKDETLSISVFVTYEFYKKYSPLVLASTCTAKEGDIVSSYPTANFKLSWPVSGSCITDGYGTPRDFTVSKIHDGIDIRASEDTDVYATLPGVVESESKDDCGGETLIILHDNGFKSKYYHLSKNDIKKIGDRVNQGEIVAKSGSTGDKQKCITDPHLHYELIDPFGTAIDPCVGFLESCKCCSDATNCKLVTNTQSSASGNIGSSSLDSTTTTTLGRTTSLDCGYTDEIFARQDCFYGAEKIRENCFKCKYCDPTTESQCQTGGCVRCEPTIGGGQCVGCPTVA